jgi:glycosyltransferase involved in cell wall biosynthesis
MVHIITPEFPPRLGGVADYTAHLARGLAASGQAVRVWCLGQSEADRHLVDYGIEALGDGYPLLGLLRFERRLNQFSGPRRIFLQWVPHGYGWRSMNVPFCLWIGWRALRHKDSIEITVHEACLPFGFGSWKTDVAAVVHRVMAAILLAAAHRVWVTIPEWERVLRPFALGRDIPFDILPVPSNIPVIDDPHAIQMVRNRYVQRPHGVLIGHFSRHSKHVKDLLRPVIPALLAGNQERIFVLIGEGGEEFRQELLQRHPEYSERLLASGSCDPVQVSLHISACDVLCQPYADGICGRHGAGIAVLSHGKPMATTRGNATETFWEEDAAIERVELGDPADFVSAVEKLLSDPSLRRVLGQKALSSYMRRLDLRCLINRLLEDAPT